MKCKLPFACEFGSFKQDEEVTDQRVLEKYPNYFASAPVLETKPEPVALETKTPKKRTRKAKAE
ncbi:hypothetical protein [Vibrio parahaemolyticus]|uniref:hypothetical protein n=1 Tax=Vibrio parahaemolyticus TaxID=670 RepID=UPI0011ED870D|nr:hypothetical protein [Vibrio parahaemolyticus]WHT10992.1 hypothetical protein O1N17_20790 [Vibrio parahaemolyticus]HCH6797441.1 hypothetical protein [Vibrio parahaemolyticus]